MIFINILWTVMVVVSLIVGIISGKGQEVANGLMDSSQDAIGACIAMCGAYVFWSGLLNVARKSGMVEWMARRLKAILNWLFPASCHDADTMGAIAMNLGADMLGLGNAATPFGVSAVKRMSMLSGGQTNDDIKMFLVINGATIQFFPTTVIAMRTAAGSKNPGDIMIATIICSLFSMMAGVLSAKLFSGMRRKNG